MILEDYNSLKEVWVELCQDVADVESQIQHNLRCIRKAEAYVNSILNSESEDFRVFSPRKAEVIHREEIEKTNIQKASYKERNDTLYRQRDILKERIKKLEKILKRQKDNLTFLSVQEEDRQRIARELHDTSLQNLSHLIHKIELSTMYIDKDPLQAKLELAIISKCLRETIDEIRGTIFDLRPMNFDNLSLKTAFEQLLLNINEDGRYKILSQIEEVECSNNLILVSIYRVVQEAFCNIEKHADADEILFYCMNSNGKCVLTIEDNGKGFDQDSCVNFSDGVKHFGISLMKERIELLNGTIEIVSIPGKGTRLSIEIPLDVMRD